MRLKWLEYHLHDDIVERLRKTASELEAHPSSSYDLLMTEAADEIERLRAAGKEAALSYEEDIDLLEEEICRLRDQLAIAQEDKEKAEARENEIADWDNMILKKNPESSA